MKSFKLLVVVALWLGLVPLLHAAATVSPQIGYLSGVSTTAGTTTTVYHAVGQNAGVYSSGNTVVVPSLLGLALLSGASVSYHANDATTGNPPGVQTKIQGESLILATNSGNLVRTGFTFAGWNTQADGLGTNYAEGASYAVDASMTLFAKWHASAGGDGTEGNPYQIADWNHLNNIRNYLDAHFVLNNSLNENSTGYATHVKDDNILVNGGQGWIPLGNAATKFTGQLDGSGFTISHLGIFRNLEDNIGLFGFVESAVIKNLGLIAVDDIVGREQVGGLIGQIIGESSVSNAYVTGSATKSVQGDRQVGALIGWVNSAQTTIADVYAAVTVGALFDSAGGLVGINAGTITNSYSVGAVLGGTNRGGLVGQNSGTAGNTNFWNTTVNAGLTSAGGVGKTTTELKTPATFTDAVWSIAFTESTDYEGQPYPGLRMADDGAVWQLTAYAVTASAIGSGSITPVNPNVGFDGTATFDVIPATGWSVDSVIGDTCGPLANTGGSVWEAVGIQGACAVTATFLINTYTVRFVDWDGTELSVQTVAHGGMASAPASPTREGYTFTSWAPAFDNISADLTVTAQYTINQYTISFDSAGGSELASITQPFNSAITAPANPTRVGYTFDEWSPAVPATMPAGDQTLTAQWKINQYTISFNSAGGSEVGPITQDFGSDVTAPEDPTRDGYTFAGWDPVLPLTMPANDAMHTAQWQVPMTLVFDTSLSEGTTITLPLAFGVNVTVDWGDGSAPSVFNTNGNKDHTYAAEGQYTVTISGTLSMFGAGNQAYPNVEKLISVTSFGNIGLTSLSGAFRDATNLTNVPTSLPPSITNLSNAFRGATSFNQNISDWDVSNVTDMSSMFWSASAFNQPLDWDDKTSSVANMSAMFRDAGSFNQNIGAWDVSNVTNMGQMFAFSIAFNGDIGAWDVSKVTNMASMFNDARAFNQNIGAWDVSNVTSMVFMFYDARLFNQNIGDWNVSNVTSMSHMFYSARAFNQPLNNWGDKTSNVTSMDNMFNRASVFNQDIGSWNFSKVTLVQNMFQFAGAFNQNIGGWNVSEVTNMSHMFDSSGTFNQDIGGWNVSKVTNMANMFRFAGAFNQDIGGWNVSSVLFMTDMFNGVTLSTANYDALLTGWSGRSVQPNVNFHGGNIKYTAAAARDVLTGSPNSWAITDGGIVSYSVTYLAGPNESIDGEASQTVDHGRDGSAVTAVPDAGHQFVRWSDGNTTETRAETNVTANINVAAEFAITIYGITYVLNDGTNSGSNPATYTIDTATITLEDATRTGYTFGGWYDNAELAGVAVTEISNGSTGTVTLYAKWTLNTYTLSYSAGDNGSIQGDSPQTVEHGSDGTAVTAQPATGFGFVQWSDGSSTNPRTDTNVTADVNVTASFGALRRIGGAVSGLAANGLVLQLNGVGHLDVGANRLFQFTQTLLEGSTYQVTVSQQPSRQLCSVTPAAAEMIGSTDILDVLVLCETDPDAITYLLAGEVTGLAGSGLVLLNNGGDALSISANGAFVFEPAYVAGTTYAVSIGQQPVGQTCGIGNATGTLDADVTTLAVSCTIQSDVQIRTIGGSLSGLQDGSVALSLNDGFDELTLSTNDDFSFPMALTEGSSYVVSVTTQPDGQLCLVDDATGVLGADYVTNVGVRCQTVDGFFVVSATAGDNGLLVSDPVLVVAENATPSFQIAADAGYSPAAPSGNCPSGSFAENVWTTGAITADCALGFGFTANTYNLSLEAQGGTVEPIAISVTFDAAIGELPVPTREGHTFNGWKAAPDGSGDFWTAATVYTIVGDSTLYAQWTINDYVVGVSANPAIGGMVSGGGGYGFGDEVTVTATPATGFGFINWTEAGEEVAALASYVFSMPANDRSLIANFSRNTYVVTATAGAGGSIAPESRNVAHGSTTTFTVTPAAGFLIDQLSGCGGSLSGNTWTTGPIMAACTVEASFLRQLLSIAIEISPAGSGQVSCDPDPVPFGGSTVCTATAAQGLMFAEWIACAGVVDGNQCRLSNVQGPIEIGARFEAPEDPPIPVPVNNPWLLLILALLTFGLAVPSLRRQLQRG